MSSPFHAGELAVQARAGVRGAARRVGEIIQHALPASARMFLDTEQFAVIAAADPRGRIWASLLSGGPGIMRAAAPDRVVLRAGPLEGDPLHDMLGDTHREVDVGLLVIDLAHRRRLRINGPARTTADGIEVRIRETYWNCSKYIQRRVLELSTGEPSAPVGAPSRSPTLSDAQRLWISTADTFFIGTVHPERGADASHRGGEPGFVRVERGDAGDDALVFPDYPGNAMFNTLGNLVQQPAAALLFVDFAHGGTLQLTGHAEVLWNRDQFGSFPGAERGVRFRVAEAIERPGAMPLRWRLVERSPANPPAPSEGVEGARRSRGP